MIIINSVNKFCYCCTCTCSN